MQSCGLGAAALFERQMRAAVRNNWGDGLLAGVNGKLSLSGEASSREK